MKLKLSLACCRYDAFFWYQGKWSKVAISLNLKRKYMLGSLHLFISSITQFSILFLRTYSAFLRKTRYISKAKRSVGIWVYSLEVHFQSINRWQRSIKSITSSCKGGWVSLSNACKSEIKNYDLKRSFSWLILSINQLYWNILNKILLPLPVL